VNQWEAFYDRHAPYYDRGAFTHHTATEVDFLLEVTGLAPGARVVDVGCGTGRHSIELAARGFNVTGVDLSSGMLREARRKAAAANVHVDWVHADATRYVAAHPFDAAFCLCGSALTTVAMDADPAAHDHAILANIRNSLVPGAPLVLTTLNGYRRIREVSDEDVVAGSFDPATMVQVRDEVFGIGGFEGPMRYKERLYTPPELIALLTAHGFAVAHCWGGTAGRWGRRPLELDEIEVMVVAHASG